MPNSAMWTGGSVTVRSALPSFVTSTIVPVSAMAMFAPLMPTDGLDELLPQGDARVVLDGLDGRLGAEDPGRVLLREVDGRRDEVRRARVRELDHALAQVGLDDLHPQRLEVRVELDLLGRHRLDLGHDRPHACAAGVLRCGVPAELADDVARLGGVLARSAPDRRPPPAAR